MRHIFIVFNGCNLLLLVVIFSVVPHLRVSLPPMDTFTSGNIALAIGLSTSSAFVRVWCGILALTFSIRKAGRIGKEWQEKLWLFAFLGVRQFFMP